MRLDLFVDDRTDLDPSHSTRTCHLLRSPIRLHLISTPHRRPREVIEAEEDRRHRPRLDDNISSRCHGALAGRLGAASAVGVEGLGRKCCGFDLGPTTLEAFLFLARSSKLRLRRRRRRRITHLDPQDHESLAHLRRRRRRRVEGPTIRPLHLSPKNPHHHHQ